MDDVQSVVVSPEPGAADSRQRQDERAGRDRQKDEERRQKEQDKEQEKLLKARRASERELLGWTRMAMTLVMTGLGAERALAYLNAVDTGRRLDPFDILRTLALCLLALGLGVLALAIVEHRRVVESTRRGEAAPEPRIALSMLVAAGVIAIFLLAFITVVVHRDVIKSVSEALPPERLDVAGLVSSAARDPYQAVK